jgi:hypothetical protein
LKNSSEGGIDAARELSDSVRELMHSTMGVQAEQCQIMVRVYANVLGLSKALARAGLVGHEARSLSPFTSSFTRAQALFDFVDAAEKKEGSDYKIRGIEQFAPCNIVVHALIRAPKLRNVPSICGAESMPPHLFCWLPRHWIRFAADSL